MRDEHGDVLTLNWTHGYAWNSASKEDALTRCSCESRLIL